MNLMLIWSRDRAQQCDTLLSSIFRYSIDIGYKITILYSYSNEEFRLGYEKLKGKWGGPDFIEKRGKKEFLDIVRASETVCFLADDNVFFAQATENVCEHMDKYGIFSYRLGLNTIVQNYFTRKLQQPLKNPEFVGHNIMRWSWPKYPADHNYGYPLSFDGHVYRTKDILPLLQEVNCDKPNTIEGGLQDHKHKMPLCLSSFKKSILVNVPLTNMSGITQSECLSLDKLNQDFLDGKILRYNFCNTKVVGCHQKIPYTIEC